MRPSWNLAKSNTEISNDLPLGGPIKPPRFVPRAVELHEQVYILAGVSPFKSSRMASFMATQVAAQPEEGIRICCEIIEQVRDLPGVTGLHIMAVHWTEAVPEIVTRSGLFPRPVLRA
jgi:5,10-methylenetetrahydrofolate reductase